MSADANIAVVALVIALLGLEIAFVQMLQQFFGTADGYRRCQQTVIGRWYNGVRLRWRWSEFRFETIVMTPTFTFCEVDGDQRFLWQVEDSDRPFAYRYDILHRLWLWWKSVPIARHGDLIVVTGTDNSRIQTLVGKKSETKDPLRYPELVGWLGLLEALHQKQEVLLQEELPEEKVVCGSPKPVLPSGYLTKGQIRKASKSASSTLTQIPPPTSPRWANFAIRLREQSWDFMPSDIVRPLARSTLGEIMVIAHRLGMRWVTVDPLSSEGTMRAEGPEYNISSTKISSLGIVLQFTYNENVWDDTPPINAVNSIISSIASDKLSFGIVPGCKELHIRDFPLVSDNEKDMSLIESMLRTLGVTEEAFRTLINERSRDEFLQGGHHEVLQGLNDAIAMLSPFMPLPKSYIAKIHHPLRQGIACARVLLHVSTRRVMIKHLRELGTGKLSTQCAWVLQLLETLEDADGNNRGLPFAQNACTNKLAENLSIKRAIFQEITTYFQKLQSEHHKRTQSPPEPEKPMHPLHAPYTPYYEIRERVYLDLVGAHVSANCTSVSLAKQNASETKQQRQPRSDGYGTPEPAWMQEAAHIYVGNVERFLDILESKGYEDREEMRDTWWMLMLRGCLWEASVFVCPWWAPPSRWFGSALPVYVS